MGKEGFGGNFDDVKLSADGTTLVVVGNSGGPWSWSEVRVAIHDVENVNRRTEGEVPTPIQTSPWEAMLDQPDDAPFVQGEPVLVVGHAVSEGSDRFLWASQLDIA
jgi:hypothetical protein